MHECQELKIYDGKAESLISFLCFSYEYIEYGDTYSDGMGKLDNKMCCYAMQTNP